MLQGRRKLLKAGWANINIGGHNLTPLVEIGLTDLPKPGWAISHPANPSPTPLCCLREMQFFRGKNTVAIRLGSKVR